HVTGVQSCALPISPGRTAGGGAPQFGSADQRRELREVLRLCRQGEAQSADSRGVTLTPPSQASRRPGYATSADSPLGRRGARTREPIKTTAAELFNASGFHGASSDDIARSLGGSRATLYEYFENME